jgi:hypothetical protein
MRYTLERFSFTRSMGIYACRNVGGTETMSIHACGRALDIGIPTLSNGRANTQLGHQIVQFYDRHAQAFGIMGQIYDRVRYDSRSPRGRYYGGVHPHYDHDHVEMRSTQAASLTYAQIVAIAGPISTGGDPMLGLTIGPIGADSVKGLGVKALQLMLLDRGEKLPQWGADGAAGDETRHALRAFQGKNGMTTGHAEYKGGVVGDDTYAMLNKPGGASVDLSGYAKTGHHHDGRYLKSVTGNK